MTGAATPSSPDRQRSRRSLGSYGVDRRPLAVPAYRRLWVASAVSAVGGSFSVVAVPTQLFTITGSSAAVGVPAAVSFVALAFAALPAGALADVADRRRLLLFAQVGAGATYLLLWAQAVAGLHSVPVLLVLAACQGVSYGTIMTATGAAVPRLVPAHLLPAATGLSSLVRYTGAVVGPLLAGVLLPVVGLADLYLLDATALIVVVWAVYRLPPLPPSAPPSPASRRAGRGTLVAAVLTGIPEGFRHLFTNRLLAAVLGVDLAAMVLGMPAACSRNWPNARTADQRAGAPPSACSTPRTRRACSRRGCCRGRSPAPVGTGRSWRAPRSPGGAPSSCSRGRPGCGSPSRRWRPAGR